MVEAVGTVAAVLDADLPALRLDRRLDASAGSMVRVLLSRVVVEPGGRNTVCVTVVTPLIPPLDTLISPLDMVDGLVLFEVELDTIPP